MPKKLSGLVRQIVLCECGVPALSSLVKRLYADANVGHAHSLPDTLTSVLYHPCSTLTAMCPVLFTILLQILFDLVDPDTRYLGPP